MNLAPPEEHLPALDPLSVKPWARLPASSHPSREALQQESQKWGLVLFLVFLLACGFLVLVLPKEALFAILPAALICFVPLSYALLEGKNALGIPLHGSKFWSHRGISPDPGVQLHFVDFACDPEKVDDHEGLSFRFWIYQFQRQEDRRRPSFWLRLLSRNQELEATDPAPESPDSDKHGKLLIESATAVPLERTEVELELVSRSIRTLWCMRAHVPIEAIAPKDRSRVLAAPPPQLSVWVVFSQGHSRDLVVEIPIPRQVWGPLFEGTPYHAGQIEFLPSTQGSPPICQVCGTEIGAKCQPCPKCETPHHPECWEFTHGCSTYGCGESSQVEAG